MTSIVERDVSANRELFLAASLMSRPELVPALFPPSLGRDNDALRHISNPVARAAITVLSTQGDAFATPGAMTAALGDLPVELDGEDIVALMGLIPEPEDVELENLVELRHHIERGVNRRELKRGLRLALQRLDNTDDDEAISELQAALQAYQRGNVGKDPTAEGILARISQGQTTVRWKVGCDLLDNQVKGIGPDGKFGSGLAGQGEVTVVAAKYGVGKTRLVLNWAIVLLDQGASVAIIAGEDNEAAYSLKLMSIKFGIEKWLIEWYLIDREDFLSKRNKDDQGRIERALEWYKSLGKRLRIYDGESKANIFKFYAAKSLLEEDCALYGTTHILVDYFQIYKGDTPTLELYAQELRELAGRKRAGVFILSQLSNETIRYGYRPGEVPGKGTGELGQIAHFGFVLETDPLVGQAEMKIVQTKGRDAGETVVYAKIETEFGRVTEYTGTPDLMPLPEDPDKPKRPTKRGGRQ